MKKHRSEKPELEDDVLVTKQVATAKLSVCGKTVERMVRLKKLTPVWILGALRFRLSEIQILIERGTV